MKALETVYTNSAAFLQDRWVKLFTLCSGIIILLWIILCERRIIFKYAICNVVFIIGGAAISGVRSSEQLSYVCTSFSTKVGNIELPCRHDSLWFFFTSASLPTSRRKTSLGLSVLQVYWCWCWKKKKNHKSSPTLIKQKCLYKQTKVTVKNAHDALDIVGPFGGSRRQGFHIGDVECNVQRLVRALAVRMKSNFIRVVSAADQNR